MILSINYLSKCVLILFSCLALASSCTAKRETAKTDFHIAKKDFPVIFLPLENLSRSQAPLKELRQMMINTLRKYGLVIIEDEITEQFMARHRIRYTGGIDGLTAKRARNEIGAKAVLVTSLELYDEDYPPKVAVTSRLISTEENTEILWIDSVALAGNDSPGILGLGIVEDIKTLQADALGMLTESLAGYLSDKSSFSINGRKRLKFYPKISYRSPVLDPDAKYTVAVVPFSNESERKYAGDMIALQFVEHLGMVSNFTVIEPGVVRQQLLSLRIVMEAGVSFANADIIFNSLNADLIITGRVFDYMDSSGTYGAPKVDFSVITIDRKSREIVWNSKSYNSGDDGVFFFDAGRVNTAHNMASEMVRHIRDLMIERQGEI